MKLGSVKLLRCIGVSKSAVVQVAVEMLASPMGDSEIARILGLTASALVLIGTIYLVANSFWATLPLLREKHRYRDLVSSRMQPKRD